MSLRATEIRSRALARATADVDPGAAGDSDRVLLLLPCRILPAEELDLLRSHKRRHARASRPSVQRLDQRAARLVRAVLHRALPRLRAGDRALCAHCQRAGLKPSGQLPCQSQCGESARHLPAHLRAADLTGERHAPLRPEFLNRLDETILFRPLTRENLDGIIDIMIASPLMYTAGSQPNAAWGEQGMETPTSMRSVDASCEAEVLANRYTAKEG